MSTRVDSTGHLIDASGKLLATGNSEKEVAARWQKILDDWGKTHKQQPGGPVPTPPPGTTIMEVELGDCQWTIAEGAGADPIKTYTQLNEQFDDPDLIDEGDIVFVDTTTHFAQDRHGNPNVDLFRDQTAGRATDIGTSADGKKALQGDIDSYLTSVGYDPVFVDTIVAPGTDKAWGANNAGGRQQILTSYFGGLDGKQRQTAGNHIAGAGDSDPLLLGDVKTVLHSFNGELLPGTQVPPVGMQRVNAYATGSYAGGVEDNTGVFTLEFKQHSADAAGGYWFDAFGKKQPPVPSYDIGNGMTFSTTENEWAHVEYKSTDYMKSAPKVTQDQLIDTLLKDPEIKGRARQVAISAYLRASDDSGKAKERLLNGADPTLKQDVEAGFKMSQRKI